MVKDKVRTSQQRVFKEIEVKHPLSRRHKLKCCEYDANEDGTLVMTVKMLGVDQTGENMLSISFNF